MKGRLAVLFLLFTVLSFAWRECCLASPGIIPVAKFTGKEAPGNVPEGWMLEKKTGTPVLKLGKEGDIAYLNLISSGNSSFGVRKETRIDVKKYPILCWRWKANKLPKGGDVRKSVTDDQALQVYVAFKEAGFLGMNTPVVGYIWDSEAPKGWSGRSPQMGGDKLRYIVLRNKTDNVGQWYTERRNIYKDYKKLFADVNNGEPQGLTTGLQLHINSQRTKSPADGMIADVYFSGEPADIALAEPDAAAAPDRIVKIAAVKPTVITKIPPVKMPAEKIPAFPECLKMNIEFETGSAIIADNYFAYMEKAADYLMRNENAKLRLVGHADNVGTEQLNLALSRSRAQSVKNYLVERLGVDPQRLVAAGEGFARPIAGNDTPEGRRQNRRVEVSDCLEDNF